MKEELEKQSIVDITIKTEIKKFEVNPEQLKEKVKSYSELVINGVDDKEGRLSVSEARKDLKKCRTSITNKAKELRDNFNKVSKAIIAREKELIEITEPTEKYLELLELEIETEEEDIKRRKAEAEQERIMTRTKLLESVGASFNGAVYSLREHTIQYAEVKLFTDQEFERAYDFFIDAYNLIEEEKQHAIVLQESKVSQYIDLLLANGYEEVLTGTFKKDEHSITKERLYSFSLEEVHNRIIEVDVLIANKEAEKLRQLKITEDNNRRLAELKELEKQQTEIRLNQEAKQKELDAKQAEIEAKEKLIRDEHERKEQLERQKLFNVRSGQLLLMGFIENGNCYTAQKIDWPPVSFDILYNAIDEAWNLLISGVEAAIENKKQQDKENLELEAKRKEELRPDIDKIKEVAETLEKNIEFLPKLSTEKGKEIIFEVAERQIWIVKYLQDQISEMGV